MRRAVEVEPDTMDYPHALADHYLRKGEWEAAGRLAARMVEKHPGNPLGQGILKFIESEMNRQRDQ